MGVESVSTVSIQNTPGTGAGLSRGLVSPQSMPLPTVLTVLTVVWVGIVFDALSLMIRAPARPSRPKLMSIPSARRGVCTRRSRPASARGDFGHPTSVRDASSLEGWAPTRNRSEAFPLHMVRSARMSRMPAATGSASWRTAKLPPLASPQRASETQAVMSDRLSKASRWPLPAAIKRSRSDRTRKYGQPNWPSRR